MSNARKRRARLARQRAQATRTERVKPTPETAAKLRPHPMELLLAKGREGGGIDADQWQCAEEIVAAGHAVASGLGVGGNVWEMRHYHHLPTSDDISPAQERLMAIWLAWAFELKRRWHIRRPFVVVERIESRLPCKPVVAQALGAALDLWAKVRREMDRPKREVSTIRRNGLDSEPPDLTGSARGSG